MIDENSSPRLPAILAVLLIAMPVAAVVPTTTAEQAQPPTLEALEWLPRGENETGAPTLRVSLTVSAPAGLAGGEVTAKAFNYQIVDTATLPSLEAGTHDILVETTMDRYEDFDRELTGLVLEGEEGQRSVYDLCDLASIGENQERPDPDDPRLDVECLPRGGGWAVWTVKATGEEAWARTWELGVSSGGGEIAGAGHVVQDEQGEFQTWGLLLGRVATDHGDEAYLRVQGDTLVNESEPDDHPHYEIVVGAGSFEQEIPQGEVLTFAAYYATEEDTFLNQRLLELKGNNVTVLDREVGDDVGLLTTEDFDFAMLACARRVRSRALGRAPTRLAR